MFRHMMKINIPTEAAVPMNRSVPKSMGSKFPRDRPQAPITKRVSEDTYQMYRAKSTYNNVSTKR